MDNNINQPQRPANGRAIAGLILLGFGSIMLLKQMHIFFIPDDFELWPLWLIFWGLFVGARSNFHKPSSFILIVLGVVFLISENIHHSGDVIWPMAIIAFGLWIILRRHSPYDKNEWGGRYQHKWDWRYHTGPNPNPNNPPMSDSTYTEVPPQGQAGPRPSGDDWLEATSVFGGVKKIILSKDFKGGEIVNVFGGAELDFTQADITGRVMIDITQIFGGVKIIVPANWQVVSDIAAVLQALTIKG